MVVNYPDNQKEISRALAWLTELGGRLTESEFELAVTARDALLDLIELVLRDLSRDPATARLVPGTSMDETGPVAVFGRALARHPRVGLDLAPSELLCLPSTSDAGTAWRALLRHTILAEHAWTTGPPPALPVSGVWSAIAGFAAAVVDLDQDLADAGARMPSCAEAALALRAASRSGLRLASERLAEVSHPGESGTRPPASAGRANRALVQVRGAADLDPAQHQLIALLQTAPHIRPERIRQITMAHSRSCLAFADVLGRSPLRQGTAVAMALRRHAVLLHRVTARPARLASLDGGDLMPLRQSLEIDQAVRRSRGRLFQELLGQADGPAASGFLEALPGTTQALSDTVDRHLLDGAWLVPNPDVLPGGTLWATARPWHAVPRQVEALRAAAVHARTLPRSLVSDGSGTPGTPDRDGAGSCAC